MNLLFYTYSYTSYNPKSWKKNKIKRYLVVLGDWSAKGQELHLCEHCRFHLMSLKLILKDRMNQLIVICLYFCSKTEFQPDSSQLSGSSLLSVKTLAWRRHWLWKVVLKRGLKTSKLYQSIRRKKKKKKNAYVLRISRIFRYGWLLVPSPSSQKVKTV